MCIKCASLEGLYVTGYQLRFGPLNDPPLLSDCCCSNGWRVHSEDTIEHYSQHHHQMSQSGAREPVTQQRKWLYPPIIRKVCTNLRRHPTFSRKYLMTYGWLIQPADSSRNCTNHCSIMTQLGAVPVVDWQYLNTSILPSDQIIPRFIIMLFEGCAVGCRVSVWLKSTSCLSIARNRRKK